MKMHIYRSCLAFALSSSLLAAGTDKKVLTQIEGTIESVTSNLGDVVIDGAHVPGPLSTQVDINLVVRCDQKFENFSFYADYNNDNTVTIYAVALASEAKVQPPVVCKGLILQKETVNLFGYYEKDQVKIEFLKLTPQGVDSFDLPENLIKIIPLDGVVVDRVAPLCPPGAQCITDGTIVHLSAVIPSCQDSVAGYAYKSTYKANEDKLHLKFFAAEYIVKKNMACTTMVHEEHFVATALMQFVDSADQVVLHLLQGN